MEHHELWVYRFEEKTSTVSSQLACPEVLERFADGKAEVELQLLGAFCQSEDIWENRPPKHGKPLQIEQRKKT